MVRQLGTFWLGVFLIAPIAMAEDSPRKLMAEETARLKSKITKLLKQLPDGYPRVDGKEVPAPPAALALRELDDPAVVPAIAALFTTERRPEARILLVEVAAKIKTDESLALMVKVAITDGDKFVRRAAIATWKEFQRADEILALLPRYIEVEQLRTAALDALEMSGIQSSAAQPPNRVLVKTLIKHLYRKEEKVMPVQYRESGIHGWAQKDGYRLGGYERTRTALVKVENVIPDVAVQRALKNLTAQDHGYDQKSWSSWANNLKR